MEGKVAEDKKEETKEEKKVEAKVEAKKPAIAVGKLKTAINLKTEMADMLKENAAKNIPLKKNQDEAEK